MSSHSENAELNIYPLEESHLEVAKHCLLFKGIDPNTLSQLADLCDMVKLSPGDTLISSGDDIDYMYLILAGELHMHGEELEEQQHIILRAGECINELSLIDKKIALATVSAVTDSELLRFKQKVFWSLIESCHSIGRNMMHILSSGQWHENAKTINEALEQRSYFEKAAYLDSLTGIHNGHWLNKALLRELERCRRNNESLSFAFLDIDDFKKITDQHGDLAGDIVLRAVAQALSKALRPTDLLARYGNREFAIVFPRANSEVVSRIIARLSEAVTELKLINCDYNALPNVSISVGLTTLASQDGTEELLNRAENALYKAKKQGTNQVASE